MATQITLPTPVLSDDFTRRHEGGDYATALRALGEAIAQQQVTESLACVRERHQGIKLVTELDEATEARAEADETFDAHIAEWDDLAKMAQEVRARDAAIEILAGMVARLIAEK